jgi:acetate kinase
MHQRRSVATTMGFTALDGLMMGSRPGSIDPGLILHLIRQRGMSAVDVAHMLNDQSRVSGVSGISDDVRVLSASSETDAREALDLFAYRAVRQAGSLIATLGGLYILVFTAGIGEHFSGGPRCPLCGLSFAGVSLDQQSNAVGARRVSEESSRIDVFVVPTTKNCHCTRGAPSCIRDGRLRSTGLTEATTLVLLSVTAARAQESGDGAAGASSRTPPAGRATRHKPVR